MNTSIPFINADQVKQLLNWDDTFKAVECALRLHFLGRINQPPRIITRTPSGLSFYVMPGFLNDSKHGALACKLATVANNSTTNNELPNVLAQICLFDDVSGKLLAVMDGTDITKWRTAVATIVASKQFVPTSFRDLAVLGAGAQAEIHVIAFMHFFEFKHVRIWNRNAEKATRLADKLTKAFPKCRFAVSGSVQTCLKEADVIVTTTSSTEALVYLDWVKPGAHINAVGVASGQVYELDMAVYKAGHLYIDSLEAAKEEMKIQFSQGIKPCGEIGGLIEGTILKPVEPRVTIFQSLGMAVEDCAMARLIYDRFMQAHPE